MKGDGSTVELRQVPVALYVRMQQHHDAVLRELTLLVMGGQGSDEHRQVMERLRTFAADPKVSFRRFIAPAEERGEREVTVRSPAGDVDLAWAEAFVDVAERADRLCEHRGLLIEPPPPEVVRLRRWILDELRGQLEEGRPPQPPPASIRGGGAAGAGRG